MKLTFSTLACPTWTLEQIISGAAGAGLQGIDFRGIGDQLDITQLPAFNENLEATLGQLRAANLELPCLNTSITLVTPDPARWRVMLDEAQRTGTLAHRTGTRLARVFGGNTPDALQPTAALILARRHLRQLAKLFAAHGCLPIVEIHDAFSTSAQVLELLRDFSPSEVGVLWDIEHPYRRGESPAQTFDALRPFIRHVHVKDSVRVKEKNVPRLLGEGDLPLRECVRVLRVGGYDGWFCLECEKRWHAEAPEPDVSLPQFAKFMMAMENER